MEGENSYSADYIPLQINADWFTGILVLTTLNVLFWCRLRLIYWLESDSINLFIRVLSSVVVDKIRSAADLVLQLLFSTKTPAALSHVNAPLFPSVHGALGTKTPHRQTKWMSRSGKYSHRIDCTVKTEPWKSFQVHHYLAECSLGQHLIKMKNLLIRPLCHSGPGRVLL